MYAKPERNRNTLSLMVINVSSLNMMGRHFLQSHLMSSLSLVAASESIALTADMIARLTPTKSSLATEQSQRQK